jgi:hypothetical protein
MNSTKFFLLTLRGECFEVEFQRMERAQNRDGTCYLFHIKDLSKNRGQRLMSIYRFGPKQIYANDYDARIETVLLNTFRQAFDLGVLSFDAPFDENRYQEIPLEASAFSQGTKATDQEIRQFIMNAAYWLGFRHNPNPGSNLQRYDMPVDLEYLGVNSEDIRRHVWLLGQQGFLDGINRAFGHPTAKLIELYESSQSVSLPNERVFPKGTQYEAFKEISRILN